MRQQTVSSITPRPFAPMRPKAEGSRLNIVFFGPPGAGKGTQADRFCERHRLPKISTGDILRRAIQEGTELGKAVEEALQRGALVDDGLMIRIVRERLERPDTAKGFVLDGFPRTVSQAQALGRVLGDRGPVVVIALSVPVDVLVHRLSSRGRADDKHGVIRERLRLYTSDTEPVLDYYRRRGMIAVLEGDRSPDEVSEAIEAVVGRSFQRDKIV